MNKNGNSVIENINNNYQELFSAERKAADFILANFQEAMMLNITELAKKSKTSEATIVRMCKHIGYQGYYQMRLMMSRDAGKGHLELGKDSVADSTKVLFDIAAARVGKLAESIQMDTLIKAAQILKESRISYVIGAGNTNPVALDLGFRLERLGIPCIYPSLPEHFLNHIRLGTSEDAILAISRSGVSKQVVQAMELAGKNNMRAIVVSGESQTSLTAYADCLIHVKEIKKIPIGGDADSHLLEMAVNDALLYVVKNYDSIVSHEKMVNRDLEDIDDIEIMLSEYKL